MKRPGLVERWLRGIVRQEIAAAEAERQAEFVQFCLDGQTASDRMLAQAPLRRRAAGPRP